MKQLTLKEYILELQKTQDKTKILEIGLSNPHSYRCYYKDLAFEWVQRQRILYE